MHNVQLELSDKVYEEVHRRAVEAGFGTVGEYIVDIVTEDLVEDSDAGDDNLDHLFTPERLAQIDAALANMNAGGKTYAMEEVRANLAELRADWIRKNSA